MNSVYQIQNVTKVYDKKDGISIVANNHINLKIRRGEILGLLGPNGAGKSTLIKQMTNIVRPTMGQILLNEWDISENPNIVPVSVAYLPQKPFSLQDLKVEQALYYVGHLRGLDRSSAKRETDVLLREWNLHPWRHRVVRHLSGGQQRLVGIASTLIHSRPILILDEPTNELDPSQRMKVWERLSELNRERQTTIILATHNIYEAEQVVDRVCIINNGSLIALGTIDELRKEARSNVRLELVFDTSFIATVLDDLTEIGQVQICSPHRIIVTIMRTKLNDALNWVRTYCDINELSEFNIRTINLEEVYVQLVEDANAPALVNDTL